MKISFIYLELYMKFQIFCQFFKWNKFSLLIYFGFCVNFNLKTWDLRQRTLLLHSCNCFLENLMIIWTEKMCECKTILHNLVIILHIASRVVLWRLFVSNVMQWVQNVDINNMMIFSVWAVRAPKQQQTITFFVRLNNVLLTM